MRSARREYPLSMKQNARRERLLRAFGTDRLNRIIDDRISNGPTLTSFKSLSQAEREYCCLVLHASEHAGTMSATERRLYREARRSYRAMLPPRRR